MMTGNPNKPSALHLPIRPTILVAPADCIQTLKEQPYLHASLAFNDAETEYALDAIREQKPSIIALDRSFVASHRGQGFIRQIKSDDALADCRIETVQIRRTPRHKLDANVEVLVHGTPVMLLDVSRAGAQVLSPEALKPRQRVRVALREGERPLLGIVVWSQFELPKGGPCYRAGIEFVSSAAGILSEFISHLNR